MSSSSHTEIISILVTTLRWSSIVVIKLMPQFKENILIFLEPFWSFSKGRKIRGKKQRRRIPSTSWWTDDSNSWAHNSRRRTQGLRSDDCVLRPTPGVKCNYVDRRQRNSRQQKNYRCRTHEIRSFELSKNVSICW